MFVVNVRWYTDPETGEPHALKHGVTEEEIHSAIAGVIEDRQGVDGVRVFVGKADDGQVLRVVYVPDLEPGSIFVITAYPLGAKALKALRRRMRRMT